MKSKTKTKVETAAVAAVVELNPDTIKKIESMAFRQVQTTSQLNHNNGKLDSLVEQLQSLTATVDKHLSRLKVPTVESDNAAFSTKCFNKISIRLRKRTVDVLVEDIHQGAKRKRLFRCESFSKAEHLLCMRTVVEGIEEVPVIKTRTASKTKPKAKSKTKTKTKTLAEVRYEMERDGIQNTVVPKTDTAYFDSTKAVVNSAESKNLAKAEKIIVKICSSGKYANAKDEELIDALIQSGFAPHVAFAAASNCGRVSNEKLSAKYVRKTATLTKHSNEY